MSHSFIFCNGTSDAGQGNHVCDQLTLVNTFHVNYP